ncbi:MAG TPA: DUF1697 domain-containing protein [Candidatus Elarobacter sp.]|nr:DUF1697 domain-containing protein [Candidatus Elarobacter sp.]
MSVWIALIRGINVGGHVMVAMADLRAFFGALGFRDARTLLQSGNVVFSGTAQTDAELEVRLEKEAAKRLGLRTSFLVRSAAEWADVVARNPFPNEAQRDPSRLHVMFLKSAPAAPAVEALQAAVTGPEVVRAGARHLYITYPDGAGRSKLTGALIEKKLGTTGTARNWNTVLKLAALAEV